MLFIRKTSNKQSAIMDIKEKILRGEPGFGKICSGAKRTMKSKEEKMFNGDRMDSRFEIRTWGWRKLEVIRFSPQTCACWASEILHKVICCSGFVCCVEICKIITKQFQTPSINFHSHQISSCNDRPLVKVLLEDIQSNYRKNQKCLVSINYFPTKEQNVSFFGLSSLEPFVLS